MNAIALSSRINGVAALTEFSNKKMNGRFAER